MNDKRKKTADESPQICKARERLKKKMEEIERKITKQALEKKSFELHRSMQKKGSDRSVLLLAGGSEEGHNTAKVSRKVASLAEKLQNELSEIQGFRVQKEEIGLE